MTKAECHALKARVAELEAAFIFLDHGWRRCMYCREETQTETNVPHHVLCILRRPWRKNV